MAYTPLAPEQWKEHIRSFRALYVIKYPRIFQSLFYLLKYREREYLCERGTNLLSWKKTKVFINDDLFTKMGDYWPSGPKEDAYKEYERLKFIQNNLKGIAEETVDEYSVPLGKLLRWIHLAIELRIADIRNRREEKQRMRAARATAIEDDNNRTEKRNTALAEAKTKYQEEWLAKKAEEAA